MLQTFFEIFATSLFAFLFCVWEGRNFANVAVRLLLLVGLVTGILLNYQHFA